MIIAEITKHASRAYFETVSFNNVMYLPSYSWLVHVCIYFWFPLWLFLELDFLLWNIVLEVSGPVYNLITRSYATYFNMNFLEVSLLL